MYFSGIVFMILGIVIFHNWIIIFDFLIMVNSLLLVS